ncbi:TPA: PcfX family protein, partial [Enterococcus faecium]|nr:PcfX family protein [Enterococcus faecium]
AIIFFDQDSISKESLDLKNLIDKMKQLNFKTNTKMDIDKILEGTKAGRMKNVVEAMMKLSNSI